MTANMTPAEQPRHHRYHAIWLLLIPLLLCLSATLWIEFAPHYIPLESINLLEASEWSPVSTTTIALNGNRLSIWSSEATLCASQSTLCEGRNQGDITPQVTNWFVQHGWKVTQRDSATGWNVCDNTGIVQKRSDLVFEKQGGMYYRPSACVVIETGSATSGLKLHVTTLNPSPLTMWND
jgi:hypothetical protein